ncbi:hypothetical protein MMC28_005419 [Mycoblastus sanguinarius]|nr:hypothetical protein [Mycoblastus sanguinarius]
MVLTFVKRPTSPLQFEEYETPSEENLCPGSDEEAIPEERAKKRVRAEILGKQYLEGRPLFILTAGLQGPFDRGWVNPWASRKRGYGAEDIRRFPEAPKTAAKSLPRHPEAESEATTARRGSRNDGRYLQAGEGVNTGAPSASISPEQGRPTAKRRRHQEVTEVDDHCNAGRPANLSSTAQREIQSHWLKTDKSHPQARLRDRKSPTPTPAARPGSRPLAPPPPAKPQPKTAPSPTASFLQKQSLRAGDQAFGFTPINKRPASTVKDGPPVKSPQPGKKLPVESSKVYVRERSLSTADDMTRNGCNEVKCLSQQAVRQGEDEEGYPQARKSSQEAASRAFQSRLTPYVSDGMLGSDVGKAASRAGSNAPRPSPHAVPPSTDLPGFQYHYSRKGSSSSSSQEKKPLVEAPEHRQRRARSSSSSSAGSSAFAGALEAAQARSKSGSMASSHSSSSVVDGREAANRKAKPQARAWKRLTFTASGEAKVVPSWTPSRPSSSSSAPKPSEIPRNGDKKSNNKLPLEADTVIPKHSTKSSDIPLSDGTRSRNSAVLPEAQIVPDAPIPLGQVPSGPSTNLLETDKQSPKFPSLDEDDSYINLSTQAAVLKAQRSFQDDVLSCLKVSPGHTRTEETRSGAYTSNRPETTPLLNGHRRPNRSVAPLIKSEPEADEEPMSTQAMADAISPFAVTTIKKRPLALTECVPSPIGAESPTPAPMMPPGSPNTVPFRTYSLSMSTSPSPSPSPPKPASPIALSHTRTKSIPTSSLTSFSILPNGTLTETSVYQDGQQPQQDFDVSLPLDPFGDFDNGNDKQNGRNGSWDLSAAIEEAGSFLGDWDVEAEARKEGSSSRRRETGPRGILSAGRSGA